MDLLLEGLGSSLFWATVIGILILVDAICYIRRQMPRVSKGKCCLAGFFATLATIISILMHELGHAGAARLFGIGVTEIGFGPLIAFVRLEKLLNQIDPWQAIAISLAGPAMNFLIGAIAAIPVRLFGESVPENTIQYISYINLRLGRLNLLPIIVLDGGKALEGFFRLLFGDANLAFWLVLAASIIYFIYWLLFGRKRKKIEDKLENL